ncbi:hypothetical protein [Rhizobium sp. BR 315]|uniref:hypothetical protein n=1 Tax=Rhizobium sp. BR 315 TaxID=3040014 RepID=UPI003D341A17
MFTIAIDEQRHHPRMTNEPLRRHFLPVFFLKKWAGADWWLVEFSKPFGNVVKPKCVHSKATGFINKLYALAGLTRELSYEVEKTFFGLSVVERLQRST